MYKYYLSFCNEQGDWEDINQMGSDNLRHMTFEARDLQRILPAERKEANCYYAVFERIETLGRGSNKLIYSAKGH